MLKTYSIQLFLFLAILQNIAGLNYKLVGDIHRIPLNDGGFKLMTTDEVIKESEIQPFVDPEESVSLFLFTRSNPTEPLKFNLDNIDDIANSTFNPNHPTRITCHGMSHSGTGFVNTNIRDEYLRVGDFNVIAVDWEEISYSDFIVARNTLPEIAKFVARLIDRLAELQLLDVDELSIIGHSAGAHLAGLIGKEVKSGLVGTVVGLDPLIDGLFDVPEERINKGDGAYVEVIHTMGYIVLLTNPMGDADFFPNSGMSQPGCKVYDLECQHLIAHVYFAESISTTVGFWSGLCDNLDEIRKKQCTGVGPYVPMGGEPSNRGRAKGLYFLRTAENAPYALGMQFP